MKSNKILNNQMVQAILSILRGYGYYPHQTKDYVALRHKDLEDTKYGKVNLAAFSFVRGSIYFESGNISRQHKDIIRLWEGFEQLKDFEDYVMFGENINNLDPSEYLYLLGERYESVVK